MSGVASYAIRSLGIKGQIDSLSANYVKELKAYVEGKVARSKH